MSIFLFVQVCSGHRKPQILIVVVLLGVRPHGVRGNHEEKDHGGSDTGVATHLSPIHRLLQTTAAGLKTERLLIQTIRLVDQKLNFLTAFQNLKDKEKRYPKNLENYRNKNSR